MGDNRIGTSVLRAQTQLIKARDRIIVKIDELEAKKQPFLAQLGGINAAIEAIDPAPPAPEQSGKVAGDAKGKN